MKYLLLISFIATLLLTSCENQQKEAENTENAESYAPIKIKPEKQIPIEFDEATRADLIKRGNQLIKEIGVAYQVELREAIKSGGMVHAIGFCNNRAMKIADSISIMEQIEVRRLAKKNRNPLNAMEDKESDIYKSFVYAWMSMEPIKPRLEVNNEHSPVYYNSITMKPICLNCHGNPETDIMPEVAARIKELYPDDKALNFKSVDLRGMWAITFPEYFVK